MNPEQLRAHQFVQEHASPQPTVGEVSCVEKNRGSMNLTTVAKVSKESGISAGAIRNALKEAKVKPDEVKAGCSYYDTAKIGEVVKKLKKG